LASSAVIQATVAAVHQRNSAKWDGHVQIWRRDCFMLEVGLRIL